MCKTLLENKLKAELFNADIDYQYALDSFKADYPHGINFCYETVLSKAATAYVRLHAAEEKYNTLVRFFECKLHGKELEIKTKQIIDKYNNAETSEEIEIAEQEYYKLYTIREEIN